MRPRMAMIAAAAIASIAKPPFHGVSRMSGPVLRPDLFYMAEDKVGAVMADDHFDVAGLGLEHADIQEHRFTVPDLLPYRVGAGWGQHEAVLHALRLDDARPRQFAISAEYGARTNRPTVGRDHDGAGQAGPQHPEAHQHKEHGRREKHRHAKPSGCIDEKLTFGHLRGPIRVKRLVGNPERQRAEDKGNAAEQQRLPADIAECRGFRQRETFIAAWETG